MTYEYTKTYICDICGMKQNREEDVCVCSNGLYACKTCIIDGKVPGHSLPYSDEQIMDVRSRHKPNEDNLMKISEEIDDELIKILFTVKRDITLSKKKKYVLIKGQNFSDAIIFEEL